jgi:hypothetical protein
MSTTHKPWIGVDLDRTLAIHNDGAYDPTHIGLPVQPMLARVRKWLTEGKTVKIFTARADQPEAVAAIRKWLDNLGLQAITEVTNRKDYQMTELWDDRAVGVVPNKGVPVEAMVAYELVNVMKAAGMKPEDGMSYADAGRHVTAKVKKAIQRIEDVAAHVDGAHDALSYVDTAALSKLEVRGDGAKAVATLIGDLERAKRAMHKAHQALIY